MIGIYFVPVTTLLNIYQLLIHRYNILMVSLVGAKLEMYISTKSLLCKSLFYARCILWIAVFLFSLLRESCQWKYSTLNWLLNSLLRDIGNPCAPPNISALFTHSKQIHSHFTRSSAAGNLYMKKLGINKQPLSFSRISMKIWNGNLYYMNWEKHSLNGNWMT